MNAMKDYERQVKEDAAKAFAGYGWADLRECFDFDLPAGWEPLFRDALVQVDSALVGTDGKLNVRQVKEKLGSLRLYCATKGASPEASDAVRAALRKAEERSVGTCVRCGEPGNMRSPRGWISPFCDAHFAAEKKRR